MKRHYNYIIATTIIFFLNLNLALAKNDPPTPNEGFDDSGVVGAPIDENIYFLVLLALIFGAYTVYKRNQKNIKVLY